jgi:hypothetical protein
LDYLCLNHKEQNGRLSERNGKPIERNGKPLEKKEEPLERNGKPLERKAVCPHQADRIHLQILILMTTTSIFRPIWVDTGLPLVQTLEQVLHHTSSLNQVVVVEKKEEPFGALNYTEVVLFVVEQGTFVKFYECFF